MTVVEPRAADGQQLASLFRQHHVELVRLAVLLVQDQPTAEDAVQDVFLRLQAKGGRFGREGEELAYIRACVLNGCRSVLRRRVVARRTGGVAVAGLAASESAESQVIRSQERREVLAALASLPARRREVLVLRYYLGLSEAEIAGALGISAGSVKSAAARGLPVAGALYRVLALSPGDVWAVGYQELPSGQHSNIGFAPYIVHWNGTKWHTTKTPPGPDGARLNGVSGSGPDDVWAVGSSVFSNKPVILHWNGASWSNSSFAAGRKLGALSDVASVSATDAWAVGDAGENGGALILHWNGVTWIKVAVPGVAREQITYLTDVAADGANDVWAVGSDFKRHTNLALHWDGRTWSVTKVPDLHGDGLGDVAIGQGGTAWVTTSPFGGQAGRVPVLRWNGAAWQRVPGPKATLEGLLGLSVPGPDSVWAVGVGDRDNGTSLRGEIFHWNGRSWKQVRYDLTGELSGITVISANSAWAVGRLGKDASTPIVLHWNGSAWKQVYGSATTGGLQTGSCGPFQSCAQDRPRSGSASVPGPSPSQGS